MASNYLVVVSNIFEADSPEDAIGQMATWISDNAYQAGYRVYVHGDDGSTIDVGFFDAEKIDWEVVNGD